MTFTILVAPFGTAWSRNDPPPRRGFGDCIRPGPVRRALGGGVARVDRKLGLRVQSHCGWAGGWMEEPGPTFGEGEDSGVRRRVEAGRILPANSELLLQGFSEQIRHVAVESFGGDAGATRKSLRRGIRSGRSIPFVAAGSAPPAAAPDGKWHADCDRCVG
jgi:hypothetical protein